MFTGSLLIALLSGIVLVALLAAIISLVQKDPVGRDDAATLKVVRVGALVYGAVALVATAVAVIGQLTSDVVEVALPTQAFWPWVPEDVEIVRPGGAATIVGGGFSEALVSLEGLSMNARVLLALGSLTQGLTQLAVTAAVYLLARRLLEGEPFQPVLSRAVMVAAVALVVGGILWQVCFSIGESLAAREALTIEGWSYPDSLGLEDPALLLPQPTFGLTIEFWPIFIGLALAAVAAAFRRGERLQRDTRGLV